MEVKDVKGIVIEENGEEHPFGVCRMVPPHLIEEEDGHDNSFVNEIVWSDWFREANIPYDPKRSIYAQMPDLTNYGLTLITNGSDVNANFEERYLYIVYAPYNISEKAKESLSLRYQELKENLNQDHAYFQGDVYREGESVLPDAFYDLDSFYDNLGIEKKMGNAKK